VNPNRNLLVALLLLVLVGPAVAADDTEGVELRSIAEVEVLTENDDGTVDRTRETAAKVVPGDEVIYTMHYRNLGGDAAEDVVITNPIPQHMLLLRAGGHAPGMMLEFSVDEGRSYDALARLEVTGRNGRPRPATASDCTHLRWVFQRPLAAGEEGQVSYVAQLQ